MMLLTERDNGRSVDMRVGDTLRITLAENASTGYRWALDRLDPKMIEAAGSEPNYPAAGVGSAGRVSFTFKTTNTGKSEIALKNWRAFEGDASAHEWFRLQVNVTS